MKTAKFPMRRAWLAVAGLMLAACTSRIEPARQALSGIDSVVGAAVADARQYIPEQLASVQGRQAELRAAFDRQDYKTVLADAPEVLTAALGLAAAAAAKKDAVLKALGSDWASLSGPLPELLATVKSRVDALASAATIPVGIDVAAANGALAEATQAWTEAQAASADGQVDEAVRRARTARERILAAAAAVKLAMPVD